MEGTGPKSGPRTFMSELQTSIQARMHKKGDSSATFIPRDALDDIWTNDRLELFIQHMEPGFDSSHIPTIKGAHLQTLSILVSIRWDEWTRFSHIFIHTSGRTDQDIPCYDLAALRDTNFLGEEWAFKFLFERVIFWPIDIEEGMNNVKPKDWRLPFLEGRSDDLGRGAYGSVTKEVIPAVHYRPSEERAFSGGPIGREVPVACKRFSNSSEFKHEARNLKILKDSLIEHDRIVRFLATVEVGNDFYILYPLAMMDLERFLEGGLNNGTGFTIPEILRGSSNLASALAFLHAGLETDPPRVCCHMDLKPANILVYPNPQSPSVGKWKITDFGISMMTQTQAGLMVPTNPDGSAYTIQRSPLARGEMPYHPPEVLDGEFGRRSDVWSLGCILVRIIAFALNGASGLRELDLRRRKDTDGITDYLDDHFHRASPGRSSRVLNPHIKAWLDGLPHAGYDLHPDLLNGCCDLLLYTLSIKKDSRPRANEVKDILRHLALVAEGSIRGYSVRKESLSSVNTVRTSEGDLTSLDSKATATTPPDCARTPTPLADTRLIAAVTNSLTQDLELLLSEQPTPDLSRQISDKKTPLYLAVEQGSLDMVQTLLKALLKAGATVDAPSADNQTALMKAARDGHVDIVSQLLVSGADATATSTDGLTSLHYATYCRTQGATLINCFREFKPELDLDLPNSQNGETPLLTLLKNYEGSALWNEKFLAFLDGRADINRADRRHVTPFSFAVSRDFHQVVRALLRTGAVPGTIPPKSKLSQKMIKVFKEANVALPASPSPDFFRFLRH
ncbi:kinase-like protein [Aspergillus campestris IBT 28561]|uniref:Kinase-like protein n=1 Tax=Aspergillus campestris (strain IBT 28561) TaxID=1392248 RepID=A0A2I1CSI4_ASPC2|nr:kinase-like protein [Aspergillus campestris IBT 28561]PKY00579.1 kinase-like protein [Aspergillus campestris IBT 28561]